MDKRGEGVNWQIVAAILMIFVLAVGAAISVPKIKDLAKGFGFFQDENATVKNVDIVNLQSTINSLLVDKKNESYKLLDEFWVEKDTAIVGFDKLCAVLNDGRGSGSCPMGGTTNTDRQFRIPKPEECNGKACICGYNDDGWGDTFEGNDNKDNFIPGSCIMFDGDVVFRASLSDPFNHGVQAGVEPEGYLVIFNGGTGGTNKQSFEYRREFFVQKTFIKEGGYNEIFVSSRTSDVDSRIKYIDSLNPKK